MQLKSHHSLSGLAITIGSALLLAGCAGHGKYTQSHKDMAQKRVSQMKSATEWDMAHQQFLSGDLKKSLATVDRSIALNDGVAKSHVLRGRILIEMGALEPSLASFDTALGIDEKSADANYFRGIVLERFGQYEDAAAAYAKASEADPTSPQYPLAGAEVLIELNRLDDAEALLTDRVRSFQYSAGIRQTLGHIAMMRKDYAKAVEMFTDACRLAAEDAALQEDLARAQIGAGRFAEAETTLGWLLSQDKENRRRDLVQLRARCLIELDRPVEARELLYKLTSDDRGANDPELWSDLGAVSIMLSDRIQLKRAAQRLVSIAPMRADGYVYMAMWQRHNGDLNAALATIRRARDLPGSAALTLEGILCREMGKEKEAAQAFALASAREKSSADPATNLLRRGDRQPGVIVEVNDDR